ncbi:PepSY domain-containing protein [Streptomyces sp. TRM70308]|uniref:PepSY domain-containing protein n=1 Tax=Streptomyces sp. TRM70308 TaxID=3131932 RepID=UPI003CFF66EE
MKRNQIIATLAAAGVIAGGVVTGTALADDDRDGSRPLRSAAGQAPAEDGTPAAAQGGTDARQAVERALGEVPGLATGLELEEDDRVWQVRVLGADEDTWHEVDVARADGRVLGVDRDDDDRDDDGDGRDPAEVRQALRGAEVDLANAAGIAAELDRGPIEEIELAGAFWSVDLDRDDRDDRDLRIDRTDGTVSADHTDDRDDADDRDDDADRDDEGARDDDADDRTDDGRDDDADDGDGDRDDDGDDRRDDADDDHDDRTDDDRDDRDDD